jgi:hypothetical protein
MCHSWYIQVAWFSLLLGWAAKVLLVRFGGIYALRAARPVFIGLVLGETLSIAIWLLVAMILAMLGVDFFPVTLVPR